MNKDLVRRYWRDASARGVVAVIDDYFAMDQVVPEGVRAFEMRRPRLVGVLRTIASRR